MIKACRVGVYVLLNMLEIYPVATEDNMHITHSLAQHDNSSIYFTHINLPHTLN